MDGVTFKNRVDAGRKLAKLLGKYKGQEAVVLALPRGGVMTAKAVAKELILRLGLIIVRKIGAPSNPEYAIAVVSESGEIIKNGTEVENVDETWFQKEVKKELNEAKRRREKYWGDKKPVEIKDKTAIIIDDGIATGLTMLSAIKEVKLQKPKKIIVAVPVSPKDVSSIIKKEVDELVTVLDEEYYRGAVGNYYSDFPQVEDEEVIKILKDPEKILLFSTPAVQTKFIKKLTAEVPFLRPKKYKTVFFRNREMQIILEDKVKGKTVMVLGSISPPPKKFLETFLLCHTLKKEGTKKIIAVFPYLAYMRQDKDEPQKSLAADLAAKTAEISGIEQIITADIHSEKAKNFFKIPLVSLSSAKIFAEKIREIKFSADTIVAPDKGAIGRAEKLKEELKIRKKIIFFEKQRLGKNIQSTIKDDGLGEKVIVIDDILDTGETLLNCVKQLSGLGVREILIVVTHGIFTGKIWKEIFKHKVTKIITTDSVPHPKKSGRKIEIISIAPVFGDYLKQHMH